MKRHPSGITERKTNHRKDKYIAVSEALIIRSPMEETIAMENRRMRLGIKKIELCRLSRITPMMYSYVLKRGRTGQSLPSECMEKIGMALRQLEKVAKSTKRTA